jgi:hypothetical protein
MNYIKKFKNFEIILEGRYDSIVNKISSEIFNYWKKDFYSGEKESIFEKEYFFDDIEIDVDAKIEFIDGFDNFLVDGGVYEPDNYLEVRFEIDPTWLPKHFSEISMWLKDLVRHEIEHLTHGDSSSLKPNKYIENDDLIRNLINAGMLDRADYFRLPKEVDANLQGMYYRAKKERRPFIDVIMDYLSSQDITEEDIENILGIWRNRAKELNLPTF